MDFFVQCPGLIFLAARWSGPATSASIFSAILDYILRVCQSLRDSFFYLGKLHWFLYLLLSYYYDPDMLILCWSLNFFGAIRTTTTNCRVSFIDLYSVFPTNFRIVFLPHTNTAVILLKPYCGTIIEPAAPVTGALTCIRRGDLFVS